MNPPDYTSLPTRFWDKVEASPGSDCWLWIGSRTAPNGYGQYYRNGRTEQAHRVSAAEVHGPIPDGMFALHHCDVKPCILPAHIYYGTQQDNVDDMWRRGRNGNASVHGERHGSAKLTDATVAEARKLHSTGNYSYNELARQFKVTKNVMREAVQGKTWKHVPLAAALAKGRAE